MKTLIMSGLLLASALTPALAADMTFERALNVAKEPQNWLLHHGNYQGHRFSPLKQINADNVKDLKVAFTVGARRLRGRWHALQVRQPRSDAAGRGRHHVRARRLGHGLRDRPHQRHQGHVQVEVRSADRQGLGRRRRLLRRQQPRRGLVEGQGDLDLRSTAACSRSTRPPARRSGSARSPIRPSARPSRSRRWWCATSRSSARPAASSASAAISTGPTSIPASRLGAPTRSRAPASPATRPGRTARSAGSTAAARSGRPRPTTPTPTHSIRASAMPAPITMSNTGRATTNGRRACWRFLLPTARSNGASSTRPTIRIDFDEISEHPIINAKINGEDRKLVVHAARNGFYYALDRTQRLVRGRQAICRSD